jgi:hypothetical protein
MKNKKLSISYIRKVSIAGEGTFQFEKETIIRRSPDQYAIVVQGGVRYIIMENTDSNEPYIIIGKLLGNKKNKNYFMASIKKDWFSDGEIGPSDMKKCLYHLLEGVKDDKEAFKNFVKLGFGIEL